MISLIGKGKITDLQGNILTSSQQSVQNWTPAGSGSVDLSYVDGVNHAEFDTTGGVDLFSRKINQYLGTSVSVNSTMYQNLCTDYNYNADHRNWKLVVAQQNNSVKFWLGANNSKDSTNTYVSGQQYIYTYNSTYTDVNTRSITFTNAEAMFFNNYNDFCQFFMIGITFSKNYTLPFAVTYDTLTEEEFRDLVNAKVGYSIKLDYRAENRSCVDSIINIWKTYGNDMGLTYSPKYNEMVFLLPMDNNIIEDTGTMVSIYPSCAYMQYYTSGYGAPDSFGGMGHSTISVYHDSAGDVYYNMGKYSDYVNTKPHLLTLSTRSTTGFTKDASKHDITLTNGNNIYTFEVNPTASQEYQQQSVLFTPTSVSCSLKLDLSGMQGSCIEIDVKDIGVYEIGGEG